MINYWSKVSNVNNSGSLYLSARDFMIVPVIVLLSQYS